MILGDAYLDLPEVLDILQDLGYIDLSEYEEEKWLPEKICITLWKKCNNKLNLKNNNVYSDWPANEKKRLDDFLKREKTTFIKLANEIYSKHLKDMQFNK